ncbi:hypothetical protein QYF36_019434 [Acer negundo]|nr:hypothetical protein QYF36_019434 [Acer negundo]
MDKTSSRKFTNICVFCGSSSSKDEGFEEAVTNLGKVLAEKRMQLVYGEEDTVGEVKIVSTMHKRKAEMLDDAYAFIVLPSGLGTLEELFEVTSWAQQKIHQKPVGLMNVNGFYDGLLSFLDYSVEKGFISIAH